MPKTQTLDRIINKIVENKPSRLDGKRRVRRSATSARPTAQSVGRTTARPDDVLTSSQHPQRNDSLSKEPFRSTVVGTPRKMEEPVTTQKDGAAQTIRRFEPRKYDFSRSFPTTASASPEIRSTVAPSVSRHGDGLGIKNDVKNDVKNNVGIGTEFGEPRVKTPRRRQIDPTTCERDYSPDEVEFMKALDEYKRSSGRMFPTCSEILEVFKSLGYVKIPTSAPETQVSRTPQTPRSTTPAFLGDADDETNVERFELTGTCAAFSLA